MTLPLLNDSDVVATSWFNEVRSRLGAGANFPGPVMKEPLVDPRHPDFGATGSGDDASAIQAAIDYINTRNGGTLLLADSFQIQSTLTVAFNGFSILGLGGGLNGMGSLWWNGASGGTMMDVQNCFDLDIRNVNFRAENLAGKCLDLATVGGIQNAKLDHVTLRDYTSVGMGINDGGGGTVTNLNAKDIVFDGNANPATTGLKTGDVGGTESLHFDGCYFFKNRSRHIDLGNHGSVAFENILTTGGPGTFDASEKQNAVSISNGATFRNWVSEDRVPGPVWASAGHGSMSSIRDFIWRSCDPDPADSSRVLLWRGEDAGLEISNGRIQHISGGVVNLHLAPNSAKGPVDVRNVVWDNATGNFTFGSNVSARVFYENGDVEIRNHNVGATPALRVYGAGGNLDFEMASGGAITMPEISDPGAPSTNQGRFYFKDNGSGKTQLVARFPTGAEQVIATEP